MTSKQNEFVTSGTLRAKNRLRTWRRPDGAMSLRDRTIRQCGRTAGRGSGGESLPPPPPGPLAKLSGGGPPPRGTESRPVSPHHGPVVAGHLWSGPSALSAELVFVDVFNKPVRAEVLGKSRGTGGGHSGFGLEVSSFWKPCGGGPSQGADLGFHPDSTTPPLTDRA